MLTYTNRKGVTYTLYRAQTATGATRYVFGHEGRSDPVAELPPGFAIRESLNGVVSLVKERPSLILPEEVAAVERAVRLHPQAEEYRVVAKHDRIEVHERDDLGFVSRDQLFRTFGISLARHSSTLQVLDAQRAHYSPQFRFRLLARAERTFGAERMCYRGSIDGWLMLQMTGSVKALADRLVSALGTQAYFDLY